MRPYRFKIVLIWQGWIDKPALYFLAFKKITTSYIFLYTKSRKFLRLRNFKSFVNVSLILFKMLKIIIK